MLLIELAIIVALILLNGLFALAELAIVSSRRARLQALVDREVVGSRRALALATDPGRFLSTVQIGITLVGVLSGAFSGATLGLRLAEWFVDLGVRASIAEAVGVGLVVAVITYLSLVIGELGPKQMALRDPEQIAVRVAPAMTALAGSASPVVSFVDMSGRAVLRALGYNAKPEHRVTDEEIRSLMAEAETAGVIEPGERAMIAGRHAAGRSPRSSDHDTAAGSGHDRSDRRSGGYPQHDRAERSFEAARPWRHPGRDARRHSGEGFARPLSARRTPGHTRARATGSDCAGYRRCARRVGCHQGVAGAYGARSRRVRPV